MLGSDGENARQLSLGKLFHFRADALPQHFGPETVRSTNSVFKFERQSCLFGHCLVSHTGNLHEEILAAWRLAQEIHAACSRNFVDRGIHADVREPSEYDGFTAR